MIVSAFIDPDTYYRMWLQIFASLVGLGNVVATVPVGNFYLTWGWNMEDGGERPEEGGWRRAYAGEGWIIIKD